MADDARDNSLKFASDFSKATEGLRESMRVLSQLPKVTLPQLPKSEPLIRSADLVTAYDPSARTNAELAKLNRHVETLVQATLNLVTTTNANAESSRSSDRRIVRIAVATAILTGLLAGLTLLLVIRSFG